MLSGFHLEKTPTWRETKVQFHFYLFSAFLPPALLCLRARLFVSLSCIHVSFRSLMAACYVISVCFSRRWQLLQWSKMDCVGKWRQLSVAVLRDVFALLQRWRTANPWHPPFLSPPPPPPPTISFRHSDCLLRLGFFFRLLLLSTLSDSLWQRSFIRAYIAYLYPPFPF